MNSLAFKNSDLYIKILIYILKSNLLILSYIIFLLLIYVISSSFYIRNHIWVENNIKRKRHLKAVFIFAFKFYLHSVITSLKEYILN